MADKGNSGGNKKEYSNQSLDDFKAGNRKNKLEMSLGEVIKSRIRDKLPADPRRQTIMIDVTDCTPPLTFRKKLKLNTSVNGTLDDRKTQGQTREYKEDVFKSLDSVIHERGISKPPSNKSKDRNDALPATGRTTRLLKNGDLSASSLFPRRHASAVTKGKPVTKGKLDPMASSLEDVIVDRGITEREIGPGEGIYERKKRFRREFEANIRKNEANGGLERPRFSEKLTPYKAITFLAKSFMVVEIKLGKKVEFNVESIHEKWRCIVKSGVVYGIADSTRKVVAREIACQDFLKKLQELYPNGKIPEHQIPSEIFLDPKVIDAVDKLGFETCSDISFEIFLDSRSTDNNGVVSSEHMYKCMYYMGSRKYFGFNPDKQYAQLNAANKVYEAICTETFPRTKYYAGEDCDLNEEYDFNES